MNYEKLDQIVDSKREEILKTMKKWLAVPSVQAPRSAENAPFGKDVRNMLDIALADAKDMGFDVKEFDGYAMHAQMGQGEETMGILCHLDVVPAGDGWTHDPWGAEIQDGKLFARGVVDDKGPAILTLYAMQAVREAGIPLKDGVRLILGCDEETGMSDMRYYAAHSDLPTYGFSPDAEFPVINIEKGGLGLLLGKVTSGDEESAEIPVYELYAGERPNVVPGSAWAKIGVKDWDAFAAKLNQVIEETGFELTLEKIEYGVYRLTAIGVSAHASVPHLGKNAAGMLLIALKKLGAGGASKEAIACLADIIGLEGDGKSLGIKQQDELSGALTCNLGILRYDQKYLSARLDIRYPIMANETEMCGKAVESAAKGGMHVLKASSHGPHHVSADHKVVKGLLKAYTEATGLEGYTIAIGGGTYSRCMPNTVAFGPVFPGDIDPCHIADEYIDIEKMMLSARIIARAIAELAGKNE
ncbi:MAG: dipeptidase PepV [Clostridia bacterium]|nr:dipeptidase PepV [Clostridia bacterium]